MPGIDDKTKLALGLERGGLPVGKLWAVPGDGAHTPHFISREFAVDHGLANPAQYPSWPLYPDARGLPVGVAARAAWKVREARLLGNPVKSAKPGHENPVTAEKPGQVLCPVCHVKPLLAPVRGPMPLACSRTCRRTLQKMAK